MLMRRSVSGVLCLVSCVLGLLFLPGCGYTTRSMISSSYRTIHVKPFINRIDISQETYVSNTYRLYRPGLETDVTKAVIDKFAFDGNLKAAPQGSADLVLEGDLTAFQREPVRYNDNQDASEYRVTISVNLILKDIKADKVVWEEPGFAGETTYFTSGTQAVSEAAAIQGALKDLARRVVERTVEQW